MKRFLVLLMLLTLSATSFAKTPDVYSDQTKGAIQGADPVAYFSLTPGANAVIGNKDINAQWNGATWYFVSKDNRLIFLENPEKYAPKYGGYCAFAVSHGFTKTTNPDAWHIVDGKLYLNLSKDVQKKWLRDVPGNIQRADANWPKVLR
ncbi:hypothetical protein A9Q79_04210 [Methylophaga sp. 42_25_T18]|nr:hypothetical protein A9Q79_04210 [Methylophaga sp. 42_25_T18]